MNTDKPRLHIPHGAQALNFFNYDFTVVPQFLYKSLYIFYFFFSFSSLLLLFLFSFSVLNDYNILLRERKGFQINFLISYRYRLYRSIFALLVLRSVFIRYYYVPVKIRTGISWYLKHQQKNDVPISNLKMHSHFPFFPFRLLELFFGVYLPPSD